jgi:DNA-binding transcriptional MerR regulator
LSSLYLDEWDVAERLALSVRTLRKWRHLGGSGPKFRKFGSAVRYAIADVEAFEQAAERKSTSDPGPEA